MEEQRAFGFRMRPRFAEVLEYIEDGEPLKLPLPDRRVSVYVQSHFYLESTEPLDENPRPHTQRGAQLEDDYVSSFLGPGPDDTNSEGPDEAFTPFGLNSPPLPQASSDSSSRLRRARPQRPEPSFNELRPEALSREPEAA